MMNEKDQGMKPICLPWLKKSARSGAVGLLRTTCALRLLVLLLLTLPTALQAQFNYITNNGTITLTSYIGPGGAVTIPSTLDDLPVTSIENRAFSNYTSLTSVTIPGNVTNIGRYAFSGHTSLMAIIVEAGNSSYSSVDGVLFDKSGTMLIQCPGGRTGSYTIPSGVISIGDLAFYYCRSLTNVTIGNSVTNIGLRAFDGCTSLVTISIPSGVASIGNFAFEACASLNAVCFQGNAPSISTFGVGRISAATVYYLPGTTGWGATFGGLPTAPWVLPNPIILNNGPSFGVQANRFGFVISWARNLSVVVEACTDLTQPVWSPVGTNTLTDGSSYFSDPLWTNRPARFYRLRSL